MFLDFVVWGFWVLGICELGILDCWVLGGVNLRIWNVGLLVFWNLELGVSDLGFGDFEFWNL